MQPTEKTTIAHERVTRSIQQLQPNKTCKCGACEPPRPKLPNGMRRLKVYCRGKKRGYGHDPVILLQGEWLRRAGFEYGDEVIVTVTEKKITVDFDKEYDGN